MNKTKETALNLMLDGSYTMQEIADHVKKTRKTLYNWLENDAEFKEEYERRQNDMSRMARARISLLASKAIDRADKILVNGKNDVAAASVIKDVLDRAGYGTDNIVHLSTDAPVQIINDIPKNDGSDRNAGTD